MRTAPEGMSAEAAGRMVVDAVRVDAPWVFPGADRHRPLLQQEIEELFAGFPEA
jgi:hypothetical protein